MKHPSIHAFLSPLRMSALAGLALALPAHAATLAAYNFDSFLAASESASTFAFAATGSSLGTASAVTFSVTTNNVLGNDVTASAAGAAFTSSANGTISAGTASSNGIAIDHVNPASFGIDATRYFTFTFTAAGAGTGVYLDTFSLDFAAPGSAVSGDRGFEVKYSIAGAALVDAGFGRRSIAGGATSNAGPNYSLDLADVVVAAGDSVEFRIYKTNSNGSGNEVRYDNFVLSGVPEPSSALLSLLGLAGLLGVRRRN